MKGVDAADLYTVSAAAELLSTTRQTVYNHIKKDPGALTTETADGKRLITLQGLGILKERLQHKPGRAVKGERIDNTAVTQNHAALKTELERLNKLTDTQEKEITRLYDSVKALTVKVEDLESDKVFLKDALNKALDRGSLWDRLFKRRRLTDGSGS